MCGTESENKRGLILFYQSNSAHDHINFVGEIEKIDGMCLAAKRDLVMAMRVYADQLERRFQVKEVIPNSLLDLSDYPHPTTGAKCLNCGKEFESRWRAKICSGKCEEEYKHK